MIKINDDLFLIKLMMNESYKSLGPEWNQISPNHKTFKKDGKLFFCEIVEELEIIEDEVISNEIITIEDAVENPTI